MTQIQVNGENLFYSVSPSQAEQSLLLLHGSGGDQASWPEALRQSPDVRVYTLDLPGHGQSQGRGRNRVEAYADCIESLVNRLGLECLAVAGHSLGGAIALTLGLRRPQWLSHLILVGTGSRLKVAPAILDGLREDFEKTVDRICAWAYGPEASKSLVETGRQGFLQCGPRVMHDDFSACNQFDVSDRLSEIRSPTLIVSGSEDRLTPLKYGHFLEEGIQDARLTVIEGGGHMMALEKPRVFRDTLLQFLS